MAWIGEAAQQASIDAGFEPIRNLSGHKMERWNLHSGVSIPMFACGPNNPGYKGEVEAGGYMLLSHSIPQEKVG